MEPNHYRRELITLRVSLARIAQQLRVETDELPVLGMEFSRLDQLAKTRENGWNLLCLKITDRLIEQSLAASRLAVSKTCVPTSGDNQDAPTTEPPTDHEPPETGHVQS
jgi:hypothetical protein